MILHEKYGISFNDLKHALFEYLEDYKDWNITDEILDIGSNLYNAVDGHSVSKQSIQLFENKFGFSEPSKHTN